MSLHVRLQRALRPFIRLHSTTATIVRRKSAMPFSFVSQDWALSRFRASSPSGVISFRRAYHGNDPISAAYRSGRGAMWTIIGLNAMVFGAWVYADSQGDFGLRNKLHQNFTLSWQNWREGRYWTVLTSAFSHRMLPHFAFNMLAFNALAGVMLFMPGVGALHLLAVCAGSAVAGSAAYLYHIQQTGATGRIQNSVLIPSSQVRVGLGASGMVMGVGSVAACLMPLAPMRLLFIPFNIPLWVITLLYAGIDTYFLHSKTSPIGHSAHLGGAVFGLVYYAVALRRFGGVAHMFRKGSRFR